MHADLTALLISFHFNILASSLASTYLYDFSLLAVSWKADLPKNTPVNVRGAKRISATVAFENLTAPRALAVPAQLRDAE